MRHSTGSGDSQTPQTYQSSLTMLIDAHRGHRRKIAARVNAPGCEPPAASSGVIKPQPWIRAMATVRCPFCHQHIDEAAFRGHVEAHQALRPDGQHTDYATLPPEEREDHDLANVPRVYAHSRCGAITGMPEEIIRTYLKDPFFYNSDNTYCCGCKRHVPLTECDWIETQENVQSYMDRIRAAATAAQRSPPRVNHVEPGWDLRSILVIIAVCVAVALALALARGFK